MTGKPLEDLGRDGCLWAIGARVPKSEPVTRAITLYCGQPTIDAKSPYCDKHSRRQAIVLRRNS